MSEQPDDTTGRMRGPDDIGPPRLVGTPFWVKPLGTLLVIGLIVLSVLAAIGANPW